MRLYQLINEGLIKSVPQDRAFSILKNKGFDIYKDGKRLTLLLRNDEKSNIENILNTIGWYIAIDNSVNDIRKIRIEPVYDKIVDNVPAILYHATRPDNMSKISKMGLVPKSKNNMSYHPSRVYAAPSLEIVKIFTDNYVYGIHKPIFLKIDTRKLNNIWYEDPNLEGGMYTTTNIPLYALERVE